MHFVLLKMFLHKWTEYFLNVFKQCWVSSHFLQLLHMYQLMFVQKFTTYNTDKY